MPRVKRGTTANKRRKNLLKHAKGFMWGRKTKYRAAKEALLHAWTFQFNDRRKKKGQFRRLWQIQIGAATQQNGLSYSKFINGLKKSSIELDRKILSDLAQHEPEIFKKIVEMSQNAIK
ncbi:MAG: 50S ribosomal protein L20 [Candidatus Yanofskybacteria bacterium]|nr:50S ribosomal protein L20 [Candidatus Yanofskybacteria bacterium]